MDYGGAAAAAGSGGGSVLKIVGDLAKGSKMPTVSAKLSWVGNGCSLCICREILNDHDYDMLCNIVYFYSFQEVRNSHVTRLQNSVGLTCGTVQEISSRHLQVQHANENLLFMPYPSYIHPW